MKAVSIGLPLLLLFVWWFIKNNTLPLIDNPLFEKAPGKLIKLSHGDVHYQQFGPSDGKLVVLIHGISSDSGVMSWLAKDLAKEGFSAIVFDAYGRGFSSAPDVVHDGQLYVDQISDLLRALNRDEETLSIVGYSMGGAIASLYGAENPDRVDKLILIAPAGLPFAVPFVATLTAIPYFGEFFVNLKWAKDVLTERARKSFMLPQKSPEQYEYVQMLTNHHNRKEGFGRTLSSTLRHFPMNNCTENYRKLGLREPKIPVTLIWGEHDTTTPYSLHKEMLELIPHAEFVPIQDANHAVLLERTDIVHPHIIKFLSK